jgi:lipid-A-disaccharide synthase
MKLDVFMVAGEASADMHAAALLKELKRLYPELRCFGVGGEKLAIEGMEVIVPSHGLNVVGGSDWIGQAREVLRSYQLVKRSLRKRLPDVAILLDLPDFNLNIAQTLKALGVPICYYISPQVWAWRKYRIKKIKRLVDEMLVLFPFEKEFYDKQGVQSTFVGHPLLESLEPRQSYRDHEEIIRSPRVAILPGSRKSEVRLHAELLRNTVSKLKKYFPSIRFEVPVASTLSVDWVKEQIGSDFIDYVEGHSREVVAQADAALVASGTATLETGLIGTPFCLFYKVSGSSAWLFRTFSRYKGYIGMPNLLRKKEVVKELFQEKATVDSLTSELVKILEGKEYRSEMIQELLKCREMLGSPGASQRAALQVHRLIQRKQENRGKNFGGLVVPQLS